MNEEYLWDKSGEPDPEIQQLEQIMGTLRYQPRPLDLGNEVQVNRRTRYLPLMAIAATLLIALLAAGLWLRLRSKTSPPLEQVKVESPSPQQVAPKDKGSIGEAQVLQQIPNPEKRIVKPVRHLRVLRDSNMTAIEREQALEAKAQLMTALRLTSEKLNLAQRKAQGPLPNQIRNQHKVG